MSDANPHISGRALGVLISGRGSNLQALVDAVRDGRLDATIAVVISNRADAPGLVRARDAGIDAIAIDHRAFPSREDFERAMIGELRGRGVSLFSAARAPPTRPLPPLVGPAPRA